MNFRSKKFITKKIYHEKTLKNKLYIFFLFWGKLNEYFLMAFRRSVFIEHKVENVNV